MLHRQLWEKLILPHFSSSSKCMGHFSPSEPLSVVEFTPSYTYEVGIWWHLSPEELLAMCLIFNHFICLQTKMVWTRKGHRPLVWWLCSVCFLAKQLICPLQQEATQGQRPAPPSLSTVAEWLPAGWGISCSARKWTILSHYTNSLCPSLVWTKIVQTDWLCFLLGYSPSNQSMSVLPPI